MTPARIFRRVLLAWLVLVGVVTPGASPPPDAQPATLAPHQRLLREIYQELVEINTTNSVGDNTKAAETMARRLLAAGFPAADVQVLAPAAAQGQSRRPAARHRRAPAAAAPRSPRRRRGQPRGLVRRPLHAARA